MECCPPGPENYFQVKIFQVGFTAKFYLNMRFLGELVDCDIRLRTHVHTGTALAVEIVQTLETFLNRNFVVTVSNKK